MKKSFEELYKAFEDRFRGPRDLIKERQKIYVPLLAHLPLKEDAPNMAIDLGCGRGEWLEVLTESGLTAVGVDANEGMAQETVERGLRIELQDAVEYLRTQPDGSVLVISAFHLVEHVPTDYLIRLLNECCRVMANGGLLILETPNPENISVATHTFHLDPTHEKPLPPTLLEFLVEQAGFSETAILRLNGAPMIGEAGPIERSIHLMFEVGRDYACLARKQGKQSKEKTGSLAAFVRVASQQVPTDITKIKAWLHAADNEIASSSDGIKAALSSSRELAARQAAIQERDAEIARLKESVAELAEQVGQLATLADSFRTSTSWRVTAPLRAIAGGARAVTRAPMVMHRSLLHHGLLWLRLRPRLEARVRRLVRLMPPVERRLIALARRSLPTIDNPVGGWTLEPDPAVLASWAGKLKVQAVR